MLEIIASTILCLKIYLLPWENQKFNKINDEGNDMKSTHCGFRIHLLIAKIV